MSWPIPRITVYFCALWISLRQMGLRRTSHCYPSSRFRTRSLNSQTATSSFPTSPLLHQSNCITPPPTETGVRWAALLYFSHALTSFSGVLTMAKVDSCSLHMSMLLFQDISEVDNKKHIPWWKFQLLGQTKESQEKRACYSGCRWEPWNWVIK